MLRATGHARMVILPSAKPPEGRAARGRPGNVWQLTHAARAAGARASGGRAFGGAPLVAARGAG